MFSPGERIFIAVVATGMVVVAVVLVFIVTLLLGS